MSKIESLPEPDKQALEYLRKCGLTQIEAAQILEIALEYDKPNRGKWWFNT